ncbi:MAG: DUF1080 domain-containing protein [Kiritimatiellaeota bacterium]|nr:DUF1080 domain-containing protein [Kiritimatiellota bacterium]
MKLTPILLAALIVLWPEATGAKEAVPAKAAEKNAAAASVIPAKTNVVVELFDGHTLAGWKVIPFGNEGKVRVLSGGVMEIGAGEILTGLVYTNKTVTQNYEITLEARRTSGSDFFCGLTFPIGTNSCTLVLGGWGGSLTGISSIDHMDASENSTSDSYKFEENRWYKVCLRVTTEKIEAWIDNDRIVNFEIEDHHLGMRAGEIEYCMPLGLATYQTRGEIRKMHMRRLAE